MRNAAAGWWGWDSSETIEASQAGQAVEAAVPPIVIDDDISEVVSKMTDIPLSKVSLQVWHVP